MGTGSLSTSRQSPTQTRSEPDFGVWVWDSAEQRVLFDGDLQELLGLQTETPHRTVDGFVELVSECDQKRFWQELTAALKARSNFSIYFRVDMPDNKKRYLHMVGSAFLGASGCASDYGGFCMKMVAVDSRSLEATRPPVEALRGRRN